MELAVHMGMLRQLGRREHWSTLGSSLGNMGVDRVVVSSSCQCCVVGELVKVNDSVPGHHVVELLCDVFRGCTLKVLGFLVKAKVVCRVVGARGLERGWKG